VSDYMQQINNPLGALAQHGQPLTTDELAVRLARAGRDYGPALLSAAWQQQYIDQAVLAAHVGDVWSGAEYPDRMLERDEWRALFAAAGYTVNGRPAPRPDGPLELWRGSVPERARDWSWTATRRIAEGYAAGTAARRPEGRLYRTVAPPEALLCHNTGRDEDEYVIDTSQLTITAV